jgi:hypothetical protein
MSTRRLNVEITGNSRGLEAALNRIDQGLGRTQSRVRGVNRDMNLWERQIAAIGTTARYALAGQFVFGITAAIARLGDFTNKLGQVASLSGNLNRSTGQYTGPSNAFMAGVGDAAILESNKVGVAVGDIQQYMQRFFSTFGDVTSGNKMGEMKGFVDEVARLAAMLGGEAGDPQVLAGGVASLVSQIRAQPGGQRLGIAQTTNRVANLIAQTIAETPNITGRDIAGQIGRMGQAMTTANMTPEQLFAVWTQAGKGGGSSAVIARGLSQLLGTSLLHPTTPDQKAAYGRVGLPSDPNMLARMGGLKVLETIMTRVAPRVRVNRRGLRGLTDENLSDEDALAASGVGAADRTLLYNLFGRQESVRQFITLIAQDGVQGIEKMIATLKKTEEVNTVRQREEAFQRQNALTRFTNARANLSLGLARGIQYPLEHVVAPPVEFVSNEITKHRTTTQVALAALFGGLAVGKAASLFRSFRKGGATPGQELVGGLLATEAMPNVLAGGPTDGTRSNPFWVIIHPDSWYVGTPGGRGMGSPTDPPGTPGFFKKFAKRVPPVLPFGGLATTAAATAVAAPFALAGYDFYNSRIGHATNVGDPYSFRGRVTNKVSVEDLIKRANPDLGWGMRKDIMYGIGKHDPPNFRPMVVEVQGKAHQDFTIKLVDAQGRTLKVEDKKGVLHFENAKQAPTYKGKSKANKTTSQVP